MPELLSAIGGLLDELIAPPTAFHFSVNVGILPLPIDCSFQEVSGLDQTMETEAVREGGENRFVHQLPLGVKQGRLSLKRGVALIASPLVLWCKETLEGGLTRRIVPMPVMVRLKGTTFIPLRVWVLDTAYPVRWEVQPFGSAKNELAIEHIELAYTTCTRML